MDKKWPVETIVIILFMATMLFGHTYIFKISRYDSNASAILFLSAIIAAGLYWVGRKRQ